MIREQIWECKKGAFVSHAEDEWLAWSTLFVCVFVTKAAALRLIGLPIPRPFYSMSQACSTTPCNSGAGRRPLTLRSPRLRCHPQAYSPDSALLPRHHRYSRMDVHSPDPVSCPMIVKSVMATLKSS